MSASRDEIARALRTSGAAFVAAAAAIPDSALDAGCYEGGWSVRELLAHVASIEWTYPRLLDVARAAGAPAPGGAGATRATAGGIDAYNARQVAARANASREDLIAEFERNREATIAAVEAAEPALLATPIRSAGGAEGALGDVLVAVAVRHVEGHLRDLLDAARPEGEGSA